MIRDPDRSIARLVSRLCPASQRFIRFHRIFEASQFMRKALGKVETIGERHPLLTSFSANARAVPRTSACANNGLSTALAKSRDVLDRQTIPSHTEISYAIWCRLAV